MHFLIAVTPTPAAADALDAQPGGPGALFAWMGERYQPDAFWVDAARRSASWIIDADASALHEITHVAARKCGVAPVVTPILLGEDAAKAIPAAMEIAALAP